MHMCRYNPVVVALFIPARRPLPLVAAPFWHFGARGEVASIPSPASFSFQRWPTDPCRALFVGGAVRQGRPIQQEICMRNVIPCPSPRGTNHERLYVVRARARLGLDAATDPAVAQADNGGAQPGAPDAYEDLMKLLAGLLSPDDMGQVEGLLEGRASVVI
jgi:hypothetical protein